MDTTNLKVHPHAMYRYKERAGCTLSKFYIRKKLLEMAATAKKAGFVTRRDAAIAMLNHKLEKADYLMHGSWVLVIRKNEIKTVFQDESNRFTDEGIRYF